jgi:hypothetical protein
MPTPLLQTQVDFLREYAQEELAILKAESELRSRRYKHEHSPPTGLAHKLIHAGRQAVIIDDQVVVLKSKTGSHRMTPQGIQVESIYPVAAAEEPTSG